MSRELDQIAKEFSKSQNAVTRAEINLYQTNINTATGSFLRSVEQQCKKQKQANVTLIAIFPTYK